MEDRIRSLCAQILAENDDQEIVPLFAELRDALHQHIQRIRAKVAAYPVAIERRNHSVVQVDGSGSSARIGSAPARITCGTCDQPLTLLAPGTCSDENGKPVHQECYVKVMLK